MFMVDHPNADGQTEHGNRVITDVLLSVCAGAPLRWSATLLVGGVHLSVVHAFTGSISFYGTASQILALRKLYHYVFQK